MQRLLTFVVGLSLCVGSVSQAEVKLEGSPKDVRDHLRDIPGTLELQGQAWEELWADRGVLTVRVLTTEASLELSVKLNETLNTRLLDGLIKGGLQKDRIRYEPFVSLPLSRSTSTRQRVHHVERVVRIDVRSADEFALVSRGVNQVNDTELGSVEYEFPEEDAKWVALVEEALKVIANKKAAYEKALGVKLIVKDIAEQRFVQERPWGKPVKSAQDSHLSAPGAAEPAVRRPRSVASIRVHALVTVEYLIISE